MERFLNLLWSGVWLGSAYGVIAVGLVMSFRAARIVNMSIGALFVLAGLLVQWLLERGFAFGVGAVIAVALAVALSAAQERLILKPIVGAPPARLLLGTLAVAVVLSGVCGVWFGRDPVTGPGPGNSVAVDVGLWHTNLDTILLVGACVGVTVTGWFALERTAIGRGITAVGMDPGAAQMLGIDVWRLRMLAMTFAGFAAGVGGVLFVPLGILDFSQGLPFTLFGFVAAAVAGYRSIGLTFLAGVGFGIVAALGTAYVSSVFSQAVAFGILAVAVLAGQSAAGLRRLS